MKKLFLITILITYSFQSFSQQLLIAWGHSDIENCTKEVYDAAQKLTSVKLLTNNLSVKSWADAFLIMNSSINNYKKDSTYLKSLTGQITNNTETKLEGTRRLIIWDRIITGDIIFEGKGLIVDNDLYKVAGRANQVLQALTGKNFGFVTINSGAEELNELQQKWLKFLSNQLVEEYQPTIFKNARMPKLSRLKTVHALIVSLQSNPRKEQIIRNCLKVVYNLDEMPADKSLPANFCNPDAYTYAYLAALFGYGKNDPAKDANWWQSFWDKNQDKLVWNDEKGIYEVN